MTPDNLLARARESGSSAQLLLQAGDLVGAVNRAYYSMFYAAQAALVHEGIELRNAKHGTVVSRFGERLVKTGRVPDHFGRWLNQALELRSIVDYGDVPPIQSQVDEILARADALLDVVTNLLAAPPAKPRGRRA